MEQARQRPKECRGGLVRAPRDTKFAVAQFARCELESLEVLKVTDELWTRRPLRRNASMPLWLQLKHVLRDILTFDLSPGDRFLSEAQIGEAFGLSRVTVRQAITSLVDEGLLQRLQGRGTFVLSPRLAETLSIFRPFLMNGFDAADLKDVSVHSVEVVSAPEWIAAKLGLEPQAEVFKIRKLLTSGKERVAFRTSYVPVALVPRLLEADLLQPLIVTLEETFGFHLASAEETLEFIIADAFRAEMLKTVANHPLILIERIVSLDGAAGVECSRTYYKADRFRFRRHLERDSAAGAAQVLAPLSHELLSAEQN